MEGFGKITYKGDYALKTVLDLAIHYEFGGVVPLSEIAGRQDIPMHYEEISIGDIVRLIEGPVEHTWKNN